MVNSQKSALVEHHKPQVMILNGMMREFSALEKTGKLIKQTILSSMKMNKN